LIKTRTKEWQTRVVIESNTGIVFIIPLIKLNIMKKYSIIVAMLMLFGASISSCSTSGKIRTKHHEVGVGAHVN
jgi:hypothetical protein